MNWVYFCKKFCVFHSHSILPVRLHRMKFLIESIISDGRILYDLFSTASLRLHSICDLSTNIDVKMWDRNVNRLVKKYIHRNWVIHGRLKMRKSSKCLAFKCVFFDYFRVYFFFCVPTPHQQFPILNKRVRLTFYRKTHTRSATHITADCSAHLKSSMKSCTEHCNAFLFAFSKWCHRMASDLYVLNVTATAHSHQFKERSRLIRDASKSY